MRAAWRGHAAVVSELIAAGAALDQQDSHGLTALAAAACAGHTAVVAQLAEAGAALDCADSQQWTALMWAADKGHTRTVQLLASLGAQLDARGSAGETAILLAARGGHAEAALALALAGADPDSRDADGVSGLMAAAAGGHSSAVLALVAAGATLSLLPPPLLQRAMQLLGQRCKVRAWHLAQLVWDALTGGRCSSLWLGPVAITADQRLAISCSPPPLLVPSIPALRRRSMAGLLYLSPHKLSAERCAGTLTGYPRLLSEWHRQHACTICYALLGLAAASTCVMIDPLPLLHDACIPCFHSQQQHAATKLFNTACTGWQASVSLACFLA